MQRGNMSKLKLRQSNIELLRIIAILFVLLDHASGMIIGLPSKADFDGSLSSSVTKIFFDSLAVGGVDIFVLISGWFGIHTTVKGVARYLFQVAFLLLLLLFCFCIYDSGYLTFDNIKATLCLYNGYWFIIAYLGLYLLSPVLNAFAETASKQQFQTLLVSLYIFQCYFTWLTGYIDYYGGYSITFFCLLYLSARYFRLYPIKIINNNGFTIFCGITLFIIVLVCVSLYFTGTAARMLRYDNPLVILSSLCLLTTFSKIRIQSTIINRLATACFAVYIIHFNPLVFPFFSRAVRQLYNNNNGVMVLLTIGAFLILVFLICFLIDTLRLIIWKFLAHER
jgi:hypothetical protein